LMELALAGAYPHPTKQAAPRFHDTDPLRSRRGGQLGPVTVLAANHEEVCGTDRTGEHAHAHLPRSWLGFGRLADLQDFRRIAEPFKHHRFHASPPSIQPLPTADLMSAFPPRRIRKRLSMDVRRARDSGKNAATIRCKAKLPIAHRIDARQLTPSRLTEGSGSKRIPAWSANRIAAGRARSSRLASGACNARPTAHSSRAASARSAC